MTTSCGSPTSDSGGIDGPISSLRGAGPVTAARLAARGIWTARDLLLRLPRGYDDLRRVTPLAAVADLPDGAVALVRGAVRRVHVFPGRLLDVFVEDPEVVGGPVIRARWFRARGAMAKTFAKGSTVALAGPVRTGKDGTRELVHPMNVTVALAARGSAGLGVRPRYPAVEGVPGRILERLYTAALARLDHGTPELLPVATQTRLGLPPLREALGRVHAPDDPRVDIADARRRITLETLVVGQLAFVVRRAAVGSATVRVRSEVAAHARAALGVALPFKLTGSQNQVIAEIAADLAGAGAMRRLLVGDVGSGKTAVAFAAAAMIAAAGGTTLMMVPTEVLAEQQARALGPLAARLGLGVAALTGGTPPAVRATTLRDAAAGRLSLLVGTQALLDAAVALPSLGLVIVDEQHRFGVADRARLAERGGAAVPHLLAMSATPIPRSLALALHGDLDASFLTERPAGRPAAATVLCLRSDEREAAYARLRDGVADSRQAFVVCPVREQARRAGAVTAVGHYARLRRQLAPARVGLIHGALGAAMKDKTLHAFARGEIDVLVATTVVELGIDVANATVMIVEDADRFGLAQLHQLRGRVGRGPAGGICFLCAAGDEISPEARTRLDLLAAVDDGFRLAEADLAQRGFGDLLGTQQAGAPTLGGEELQDLLDLTRIARGEAERIIGEDPALTWPAHELLARAVRARLETTFGAEAG